MQEQDMNKGNAEVYVLWWQYSDGSNKPQMKKVFTKEKTAKDFLEIIKETDVADEWHLTSVELSER